MSKTTRATHALTKLGVAFTLHLKGKPRQRL